MAPGPRSFFTGDWAVGGGGHLYPNKAPGVSMLAVPAYAALYGLERAAGVEPRTPAWTRINTIALNLWCSVLWTAAASVLLLHFLGAAGLGPADALLGVFAYAFGTLVFPYDTSTWGHTTAAAGLLASLCLAGWPGGARRPLLAGLLGGFAVLTEYVAVFPLAAVGLVLLAPRVRWRERLAFGAGAALPLLVLLLYQKAVFGGFLVTATSRENPIFLDRARLFGVLGGVDWTAVWGLSFSWWRGLFTYCPVLAFAAVGGWQRWRQHQRLWVAACASGFAACVLFISTFNGWWGGWASGPRYLIVALPLLAVLAPRSGALAPWLRPLHPAALALSACNMLALTAVEVMSDEAEKNPLYGLAYRLLLSGRYPQNGDTANLGLWLGLRPRFDLLPFLLVFGGWAAWLLWRSRSREEAARA